MKQTHEKGANMKTENYGLNLGGFGAIFREIEEDCHPAPRWVHANGGTKGRFKGAGNGSLKFWNDYKVNVPAELAELISDHNDHPTTWKRYDQWQYPELGFEIETSKNGNIVYYRMNAVNLMKLNALIAELAELPTDGCWICDEEDCGWIEPHVEVAKQYIDWVVEWDKKHNGGHIMVSMAPRDEITELTDRQREDIYGWK